MIEPGRRWGYSEREMIAAVGRMVSGGRLIESGRRHGKRYAAKKVLSFMDEAGLYDLAMSNQPVALVYEWLTGPTEQQLKPRAEAWRTFRASQRCLLGSTLNRLARATAEALARGGVK